MSDRADELNVKAVEVGENTKGRIRSESKGEDGTDAETELEKDVVDDEGVSSSSEKDSSSMDEITSMEGSWPDELIRRLSA